MASRAATGTRREDCNPRASCGSACIHGAFKVDSSGFCEDRPSIAIVAMHTRQASLRAG